MCDELGAELCLQGEFTAPCVLALHVSSGVRARVPVVNSLTQIHANAAASAPQPYTNKQPNAHFFLFFIFFIFFIFMPWKRW